MGLRFTFAASACALALSACTGLEAAPRAAALEPQPMGAQARAVEITPGGVEAHMRFLADDLLAGRLAGEPGYDIAARYVEAHYRLVGLEPAGEHDSFYQTVPLQLMRAVVDGGALAIKGEALEPGEDFIASAHGVHDQSAIEAEAVFVGHGLNVPSLGLNAYEGVELDGKIAVILLASPQGLPGDVAAHLNATRTRAQHAAEAGAAGLIVIRPQGVTRWTFERLIRFIGRERMSTEAAALSTELNVVATISEAAANRLFAAGGHDFETIAAAARAGAAVESFPLGVTVSLGQETARDTLQSDNVMAVLPGSDPMLADEPVVVTAHLDHVGACGPAEAADRICNGAIDNAAGVAIMLETARAMAAGPAPRRPVVFVALAAEEQGLLGSAHLAVNPTPATRGAVANVNLDMPVILYEFSDLLAFGAEHSSLGPLAATAAARMGVQLSPDPIPEQAFFTRSDHYNFVRAGVPSLFLMTGFSSPQEAADEGRGFMGFLNGDYHGPGDDMSQPIRFDEGAKFARINQAVIEAIANAEDTPSWNADSVFAP